MCDFCKHIFDPEYDINVFFCDWIDEKGKFRAATMITLEQEKDGTPVLAAEMLDEQDRTVSTAIMKISYCPVCGIKLPITRGCDYYFPMPWLN